MDEMEILKEGLTKLGIKFTSAHLEVLDLYIREIELWNSKYKLVGAGGEQLVIKHILDSLSAVPILKEFTFKTAADVGSGAGLPGIPLAIFFPDVLFTLIERSGRRVGFLRNIISLLNLGKRVEIIESGVEEVHCEFDLVLFRAFRNLTNYYKILDGITSPGGTLFAYKGRIENIRSEISGFGQGVKINIRPAIVPFLNEERNFCIFRSG
ncbi:MAG: 16S rRNA (guanine(527)-N(7))-methyltransferase RsmG [Spirochaetales bacterium]|nr:16S rRNA (guanine(527)-N(7))-methyltransferase RsmG [Spirochaetales bacterium]